LNVKENELFCQSHNKNWNPTTCSIWITKNTSLQVRACYSNP
jgi:hypothetical protein